MAPRLSGQNRIDEHSGYFRRRIDMKSLWKDWSKKVREHQRDALSGTMLIPLSTDHGGSHDCKRPETNFSDVPLQLAFCFWVKERRLGGCSNGGDEREVLCSLFVCLLRERQRQIVVYRTECFFRSRLLAGCAGCADYGVGSPACHLRQKFLQLWGHRVHQSILRWQWFPSWRDDLRDHRSYQNLGQRISSYQSRRSEYHDFHRPPAEEYCVRWLYRLNTQTTPPAPGSFRR
jgi:hypothetical protein